MNKILPILLFAAVAAQAKVIPELVDRIAFFPDILRKLGLDKVSATSNRIVGGEMAVPHSAPWQVLITINGNGICGGSIISAAWVLTAAHCSSGSPSLSILAGAHNRDGTDPTSVTVSASRIIVHPGYNYSLFQNDVAVVELQSPLTYTPEIQPICLAQPSTINLTPGDMLTVTGWGKLVDGTFTGPSIYLYTADIPYADNSVCSDVYGDIMIESTLCCSSINGTSTCNGDSGGPLTELQGQGKAVHQVGIVSFGSVAGCSKNYPMGFARVSSFYDWIATNAEVEGLCR